MRRHSLAIILALAYAAEAAAGAGAQGVIIRGASSAQYIELQPLALDSVPFALTDSAWGIYRQTASGILVQCDALGHSCSYFCSAPRTSLVAMTQDLDVTGWGLGEGVSVHTQLR